MAYLEQARGNRLLALLPADDLEAVLGSARVADHPARERFVSRGQLVQTVSFPFEGMASMVGIDDRGGAVEVATIGAEGVVGANAIFHDVGSPFEMMWQLPGTAVEVSMADLRTQMQVRPALAALLARYLGSLFVQAAQNGACNRLHDLEERAAKWLLLTHDRVASDTLELSQEFFAIMLGVTRPKLSLIERRLRHAGHIAKRRRGSLTILDREGLEAMVCECYAVIADDMASLRAGTSGI